MFENPTSSASTSIDLVDAITNNEPAVVPAFESTLWQSTRDAFERLARLEVDNETSERKLAMQALSAVYELYFKVDGEGILEALYAHRGLEISKQTRNPSSPLVGHFLKMTKGANDRSKQSSWSSALELALENSIQPSHFLEYMGGLGGVETAAKLRREEKKTKTERLEELKQAKADEDAFLKENTPVQLPSRGMLTGLSAGYHTVIVKCFQDGSVEALTRVPETSEAAHKRLRRAIKAQEEPAPAKPEPQHRHKHKGGSRPITLANVDPAIVNAETKHTHLRRQLSETENVLKSGKHSRKLGSIVSVGEWKGFPIYSFALEERATCPSNREQWINCFGNGMSQPRAWRYAHGPELEEQLAKEFEILSSDPATSDGFVIRIHSLGDFYSVGYVKWWTEQFDKNPAMRAWCYTAHSKNTEIGVELQKLARAFPERFSLRWSDCGDVANSILVVDPTAVDITKISHLVCPAQTGSKADCGSCAFCWSSTKPIVFLKH
jgi:hypothetical protein